MLLTARLLAISLICASFDIGGTSPKFSDSKSLSRKNGIQEEKLIQKDSLIIIGNLFTVNNINCFWKLTERFYNNEDIGESTMELVNSTNKKAILKVKDIYGNDNYTDANINSKNAKNFRDANFDGNLDYVVLNEFGSGQGGDFYEVYLFDKKTRTFIANNEFAGGNIQLDSIQKTVKTYWKAGIGWNQEVLHQFSNNGKLKFTETYITEIIEEDSVRTTYKKEINNKVVSLKVTTTAKE